MILEYYQESMPAIDETEKYINLRLGKIEELVYQNKEKKKLLLDPVLKISLDAVIQTAQNNQKNYAAIAKSAKEIIAEINKEENNYILSRRGLQPFHQRFSGGA